MTSPHTWRVGNKEIGEHEELSDAQLWDLLRASIPGLNLGVWEQQDASTQQGWFEFLCDIDAGDGSGPKGPRTATKEEAWKARKEEA